MDINAVYDALRRADAAGDTESAQKLADYIRQQTSPPEPVAPPTPAPEQQSLLRQVADVPLKVGAGVLSGFRMLTDSLGANNPVSQQLTGMEDSVAALFSAQSKNDSNEVSRIMKEAQDKGYGDQITAALQAFATAPVDISVNALGTMAPIIFGQLLKKGLQVIGVASKAAPTVSNLFTRLVPSKTSTAIGSVMGAGVIKGGIYDAVKEELTKIGMPPDQVEARAQLAQDYNGENLGLILSGVALGGLTAVTGVDPLLVKGMAKKIAGDVSKEVAKKGVVRQAVETGAAEAIPEMLQGGQEQYAKNVALQKEGFDVPTMRGVVGSGALEGLAGGVLGAGVGAISTQGGPEKETEDPKVEDPIYEEKADTEQVQNAKDKKYNSIVDLLMTDHVDERGNIIPKVTEIEAMQQAGVIVQKEETKRRRGKGKNKKIVEDVTLAPEPRVLETPTPKAQVISTPEVPVTPAAFKTFMPLTPEQVQEYELIQVQNAKNNKFNSIVSTLMTDHVDERGDSVGKVSLQEALQQANAIMQIKEAPTQETTPELVTPAPEALETPEVPVTPAPTPALEPEVLEAPNQVTPDLLANLGIPRQAGIYKRLVGKDMANPEDRAFVVTQLLTHAANAKVPLEVKEKIKEFLTGVQNGTLRNETSNKTSAEINTRTPDGSVSTLEEPQDKVSEPPVEEAIVQGVVNDQENNGFLNVGKETASTTLSVAERAQKPKKERESWEALLERVKIEGKARRDARARTVERNSEAKARVQKEKNELKFIAQQRKELSRERKAKNKADLRRGNALVKEINDSYLKRAKIKERQEKQREATRVKKEAQEEKVRVIKEAQEEKVRVIKEAQEEKARGKAEAREDAKAQEEKARKEAEALKKAGEEAEAEKKLEAELEAESEAIQEQAEADVDAGPIGRAIAKIEDGDFETKAQVRSFVDKLERKGVLDDVGDVREGLSDREQDVEDVLSTLSELLDEARDNAVQELVDERKLEADVKREEFKKIEKRITDKKEEDLIITDAANTYNADWEDSVLRTAPKGTKGISVEEVKKAVGNIAAKWVNAPEINVIQSVSDLPSHVQKRVNIRKDEVPKGLFDPQTKKVYLIADHITDSRDAVITVAHEALGHYGLRAVLGNKYTGMMNNIYNTNKAVREAADIKIKKEGLDKATAVEEVLADMQGERAVKSIWQFIKNITRQFLQKLGVTKPTDKEINDLLARARDFVVEGVGKGRGRQIEGNEVLASAKVDRMRATGSFKAWILFSEANKEVNFGNLKTREQMEEAAEKRYKEQIKTTPEFDGAAYLEGLTIDDINAYPPEIQDAIQMYKDGDKAGGIQEIFNTVSAQRRENIREWKQYLENVNQETAKDPFWRDYVITSLLKSIRTDKPDTGLPLNADALGRVYVKFKEGENINFDKAYRVSLIESTKDLVELGDETTGWRKIPQTNEDDPKFGERVKAVQSLSCIGWCTRNAMASVFIQKGDFWVYVDDKKPQVAIRFDGDQVQEIQGPQNTRAIPTKYIKEITNLVDSGKIKNMTEETKGDIARAVEKSQFEAMIKEKLASGELVEKDRAFAKKNGLNIAKEAKVYVDVDGWITVDGYVDINNGASAPKLTTVSGAIDIYKGASAPALTTVGGDAFINKGGSAPKLTTVGGNLSMYEGASAPKLTTVGGSLNIHEGVSVPALTTVGGKLSMFKGASVPKLTTVGGDAFMHQEASAPALTTVSGEIDILKGASAPALTTVGGDAFIDEGGSAPKLTTVGGNLIMYEGVSAPALTTVGGKLSMFKGASAPNITRQNIGKEAALKGTPLDPNKQVENKEDDRIVYSKKKINKLDEKLKASHSATDLNVGIGRLIKTTRNAKDAIQLLKAVKDGLNVESIRKILPTLTTQDIARWIGGKIANINKVNDAVQEMSGMRHKMLRELSEQVPAWAKFNRKSKKGGELLADVMNAATLEQVDPDKYKTLADALQNDAELKRLKRAYVDPNLEGRKKSAVMGLITKRKNQITKLYTMWDSLGKIAGGKGHNIYRMARDKYKETLHLHEQILTEKISLSSVPGSIDDSSTPKGKLMAEITKMFQEAKKLNIYFPLMRYGPFWFSIGEGPSGEQFMFESATARNNAVDKYIAELNSKGDSRTKEKMVEDLTLDFGDNLLQMRDGVVEASQMLKGIFELLDTNEPSDIEAIKDGIYQMYLRTLPEKDIRRRFTHRQGKTGFSADVLRNFITSQNTASNQLSRLKYSDKIRNALGSAYDELKGNPDKLRLNAFVDEITLRVGAELMPQVTEEFNLDALASLGNQAVFLYMLTAPKSALVQMTQLPIVGLPVLQAEYGFANASKAFARYSFLFNKLGTSKKDADGNVTTKWGQPSINNSSYINKHPNSRALKIAWEAANNRDIFMSTYASDMTSRARTSTSEYEAWTGKGFRSVVNFMSGAFHHLERISREIMYMASFELEFAKLKKEGMSDADATERGIKKAISLIDEALFNYTQFNKPRFMKAGLMRIPTQFMTYPLQMTSFLTRNFFAMFLKLPAKDRKDAAVKFFGTLGMTGLFAGAVGLPLYSVIMGAAEGVRELMRPDMDSDDDDPYYDENDEGHPLGKRSLDLWFRETFIPEFFGKDSSLAKALGLTDEQALMLQRGVKMGLISALTDLNIGASTSLNNLWFTEEIPAENSKEAFHQMLVSATGPFGGMIEQMVGAFDDFNGGHINRGVEKILPAFLRGYATAFRLHNEGLQTRLGYVIRKKEWYAVDKLIPQALGIQSTETAEAQKRNFLASKMKNEIKNAKKEALDNFDLAIRNYIDDDSKINEEKISKTIKDIRVYNYKNNPYVINGDQLNKLVESHAKKRAIAIEGLGVDDLDYAVINPLVDKARVPQK